MISRSSAIGHRKSGRVKVHIPPLFGEGGRVGDPGLARAQGLDGFELPHAGHGDGQLGGDAGVVINRFLEGLHVRDEIDQLVDALKRLRGLGVAVLGGR